MSFIQKNTPDYLKKRMLRTQIALYPNVVSSLMGKTQISPMPLSKNDINDMLLSAMLLLRWTSTFYFWTRWRYHFLRSSVLKTTVRYYLLYWINTLNASLSHLHWHISQTTFQRTQQKTPSCWETLRLTYASC